MKKIPVFGGHYALVDDQDYERLSQFKWHLNAYGYACRTEHYGRGSSPQKRNIYMHREICETTDDAPLVDHKNQNRLDNRRANLRACTKSENGANRGATSFNKSGYKGVVRHRSKKCRGYIAQIRVNGRNRYIGYYADPKDAARAYDAVAIKEFGQFAVLNNV